MGKINIENRMKGIASIAKSLKRKKRKELTQMNRKFARIITCLLDEKLNLPSMMLESIEENLVKGNFDKVYEYYCKRLTEIGEIK